MPKLPANIISKSSPPGRASGFPDQRLVVVHPPQIARARKTALLQTFFPTDVGVFVSALHHERKRPSGAAQTIFIHCSRGEGWCELEGVRHLVRKGDLLVVPARCPHAYGASAENPWSIEWFHAIGTGIPEHMRQLGVSQRSPIVSLRPGLWDSQLFEEGLSSLETGFTQTHLIHTALTLSLLLSRITFQKHQRMEDHTSVSARVEKVAAFVRENYAQPISVSKMATLAGLSMSHFSNLFLKHTGYPPMEYLTRTRIDRACRLLDLSSLSIKEIAEQVGYSDPYYFSRLFKKTTACSPKTYRNTRKG